MNTITRLLIAPFLVLSITVLGCAVFPGQQEDVSFPQKQEQSSAKIILPAANRSAEVQSIKSSDDKSESTVIRDLPSQTNATGSQSSARQDNWNQSIATTRQNRSSVPDGLVPDDAAFVPARTDDVIQADQIAFGSDAVPFGSRLRTASYSTIEPQPIPKTVDDALKDASMSISDTILVPPEAGTIFWTIDAVLQSPVPIRSNSISLDFTPDPDLAVSANERKLLIEVGGKFFSRKADKAIDLNEKAQVTTYKFSDTWDPSDTVVVTVNDVPGLPIVSGSNELPKIIDNLVATLNASGDIVWSRDEDLLVATAKTVATPFSCTVVATQVGASSNPTIAVGVNVTTAQGDKETNDLFDPGLGTVTLNNLPVGETVDIKIWIEEEITKNTPNLLTFRKFQVVTPKPDPTAPVITKVSNSVHLDAETFTSSDIYNFYGIKPYIRLEGRNGTPASGELKFILRDKAGRPVDAVVEIRNVEAINTVQGTWKAELNVSKILPKLNAEDFKTLYVLRTTSAGQNYSVTPIKFNTAEKFNGVLPDPMTAEVKSISKQANGLYLTNTTEITLTGPVGESTSETIPSDVAIVATKNGGTTFLGAAKGQAKWEIDIKGLSEGRQDIVVDLMLGEKFQNAAVTIPVFVQTKGPRVISVEPSNFGTAPGISSMTIAFDPNNPLSDQAWTDFKDITKLHATFSITGSNGTGVFTGAQVAITDPLNTASPAVPNKPGNAITLMFDRAKLPADIYQLEIKGEKIQDVYGNFLVGDDGEQGTRYTKILGGGAIAASGGLASKFDADDSPTVNPAISDSTGEFVAYPEFVRRPDVPDGFNPNDKVETRVVRLYYYRDAHRIAQIVNRKVQSYNRAAVKTNRQLADKARSQANQLTVQRQNSERNAIILAGKTRQQENDLQQAENSLNGSLQQLTNYRRENPNADASTDPMIQQLESLVSAFSNKVNNLRSDVQRSRDQEVQANEQAQQAEAEEKLAREEQFRREVAAAHSDPDTYAPGKINSVDPVEQVSVSVVGEGMIQLRGPLKGINLIRTAIDQLDAPVGQVRISLHTIQINGEHADRMEVVAKKVQTYIDHARFLTMQSSEMLRKAVVQVASQKAEEASALFPGSTQMDRDERYIMAFFGKDFIDELKAMDSEFLHTGNKLLSLHSMDTTSLASALNLMALAKNSTRQDIFATFDEMLQIQLPQAEQNYFAAGWTCQKKKNNVFHRCKQCEPEYCPMAGNARFESLRGFFDMQISNDDTMTPLQREFIRLAQIFKSRLVTELEYKQRVMERAIIEERLGNRKEELQAAIALEKAAMNDLKAAEKLSIDQRIQLITMANVVAQEVKSEVPKKLKEFLDATADIQATLRKFNKIENARISPNTLYDINSSSVNGIIAMYAEYRQKADSLFSILKELYALGGETAFNGFPELEQQWNRSEGLLKDLPREIVINKLSVKNADGTEVELNVANADELRAIDDMYNYLALYTDRKKESRGVLLLAAYSNRLQESLRNLLGQLLQNDSLNANELYSDWTNLKTDYLVNVINKLYGGSNITAGDVIRRQAMLDKIESADNSFREFIAIGVKLQFAQTRAKQSRRPLDHKKFLDMLVDDLEEKYIELLDGTRAHVANIDNYLKRVTTALDDDFNTQFYYPAFKYIREANVSYDVQFGQFETTTLLANNREFAKADPSATMEFDLPERDILIAEGINGAKAMMGDIGALANDPTFLAMAKLNGPNSTSSFNRGASGGNGVVRNVLPGLGGSTSEQVMSQNSNGGQQFGSNLENLIPDPAVYKFETGTGFEIRPVIQPDGQAVVFDFNYMYTTEIREPVRADEKHLGRVKRHFVDTDVQLSNFELREVSRYTVALKAARTAKGVPLFEDIPGVGVLFRPLPSDENSLQQNLIMAQATIFPTLFDLMGLRWASVVSDLDPMTLSTSDFVVRNRHRMLENRVYDESSSYVDEFLRVPEGERRMDLYRSQETVPYIHPNGYNGPGMNLQDSQMQEGYQPTQTYPSRSFVPNQSIEGASDPPFRRPTKQFYDQNRATESLNPTGIREPLHIRNPLGR